MATKTLEARFEHLTVTDENELATNMLKSKVSSINLFQSSFLLILTLGRRRIKALLLPCQASNPEPISSNMHFKLATNLARTPGRRPQ